MVNHPTPFRPGDLTVPHRLSRTVTDRMLIAFERSDRDSLEVLAEAEISMHRFAEFIDGRDYPTVTEVLLVALALGLDASTWFRGLGEQPEVVR